MRHNNLELLGWEATASRGCPFFLCTFPSSSLISLVGGVKEGSFSPQADVRHRQRVWCATLEISTLATMTLPS